MNLKILEFYKKLGFEILCGVELEFYSQTEPKENFEADLIKPEEGKGQFEAIFYATKDLPNLCAKIASFKRNSSFNFAAKPYFDTHSSAMQFNLSFPSAGFEELGKILAGMLFTLDSASTFLAKNANCFERLTNREEAAKFRNSPTAICYGLRANRTAALRLLSEEGAKYFFDDKPLLGYRIEHRVPSPMASPSLALSAILLGGLYGLANELELGEPLHENAFEKDGLPRFPSSKAVALRKYKDGEFRRFIKKILYEK